MRISDYAGQIVDIDLVDFDVVHSVACAFDDRLSQSKSRIDGHSVVDAVSGVAKAPVEHLPGHVGLKIRNHLVESARSREIGNEC